MATPAQQAATRELASITAAIAGAPGEEHRGAEFWVTVTQRLCAKYGCSRLSHEDEATPSPNPLTRRQAALLGDVAKGLTYGEIAAAGFISLNTVKTTLSNAYGALGAKSAAQAVSIAQTNGWLPD